VFVRALESPPTNPKPWLFAVALNLARDDGRRSVRQGRRLEVLAAERQGDAAPAPDAQLQAEGFRYAEIATALGLAPGAVGTTLARARRRLVEAYRARGTGGDGAR